MKKIFVLSCICIIVKINLFAQADDGFKKFPVFNFQKSTEKIFGATSVKRNEFIWKPNYAELFDFSEYVSTDGYCHTKLDTAIDFTDGNTKYMMLAYSTIKYENGTPNDCHACAPIASIAVFKKEADNTFTLENFKKGFTSSGGFGLIGHYSIQKIAPNESALVLESGYMEQGEYQNQRAYYSFTPGSFLAKIFSYINEAGNNNDGSSEKKSAQTMPLPKARYYDILLTTTKNGKVLPAKDRYTFDDESGVYIKRNK